MAEYYNFDGVVVQNGIPVKKEFGKGSKAQGAFVFKIKPGQYPQAASSAFPLKGQIVNETYKSMSENMIITRVTARADSPNTNGVAGSFDVAVWAVDDHRNPSAQNIVTLRTFAATDLDTAGEVASSDVGFSGKAYPGREYFLVVEGDIENWTGFEGTVIVEYIEA